MKEPGRRQGSVSRGGAKQVVGGISGGSIINDMQAQALSIPCEKNKSIRETSCGVTVRRRISRRRNEWPKAKRHYTIVGECLNPRLNVLLRDPSQQPFSGKNGRSCPIRKFTSQPQSQSRSHSGGFSCTISTCTEVLNLERNASRDTRGFKSTFEHWFDPFGVSESALISEIPLKCSILIAGFAPLVFFGFA